MSEAVATEVVAPQAPAMSPGEAAKAARLAQKAPDPPSRDEEITEQIKRAEAKVAAAETPAPPERPKRKAKTKTEAKPEPEQPPAHQAAELTDEKQAEAVAQSDEAGNDKPVTGSPRALLKEGKIKDAFLAAFGQPPEAFNINSARWEAYQKKTRHEKRELSAARDQVTQAAATLRQEFAPFVQARAAWQAGDVEEFVRIVTDGEADANEFSRRLLHSKYGKNPEVERLRRELQERDQREQEARQRWAQQEQERARAHEVAQYKSGLRDQLGASDDPSVSAASDDPQYIEYVFAIMSEHYDEDTNSTLPLAEAAELALDKIRQVHQRWDRVFKPGPGANPVIAERGGIPATTVLGGRNPGSPGTRVPTTLRQNGAAEASTPGRALTEEELFAKYEKEMKRAQG